jgi:hypothetical protein
MRLSILIGCLFLISACQGEAPQTEGKPRPQTGQITYIGGMFLNSTLNSMVERESSHRKRRRSLRKPLWGLYELLKGPDVVRLKTHTVSAIYRPFGEDSKLPHPGLAEMLSLAGIDTVTVAAPALSVAEAQELASTREALEAVGVGAVGLAAETTANSISGVEVRVVDLEDAKVALLGLYLTDEDIPGNGVAALPIGEPDAAVSAVEQALAEGGKGADLAFLLLGWHSKTDLKPRRDICHAMIDRAGVDAVLSHHAGTMEGLEAHGGGLIIHNPGPALLMNLDEDTVQPALVFRIHLKDKAVSWVEIQPIEARRKRAKVGMGRELTHGTIRRLMRLSKELGTVVSAEHGRGIWEPSAE